MADCLFNGRCKTTEKGQTICKPCSIKDKENNRILCLGCRNTYKDRIVAEKEDKCFIPMFREIC